MPETSSIPTGKFNVSDEKKVDVLLALMTNVRENIRYWTEQSYNATVWSIGLMVSISGFWLLSGSRTAQLRYALLFGVIVFGLLTQWYLSRLRRSFNADGSALVKLEAALKLCDKDAYVDGQFFGYTGKWFKPTQAVHLAWTHVIVMIFSAGILLLVK